MVAQSKVGARRQSKRVQTKTRKVPAMPEQMKGQEKFWHFCTNHWEWEKHPDKVIEAMADAYGYRRLSIAGAPGRTTGSGLIVPS